MEHIHRPIRGECRLHVFESFEKEGIKLLVVIKFVVFDFTRRALIINPVGRVGQNEVGLLTDAWEASAGLGLHECGVGFGLSAVAADETMPPQCPNITTS